MDFCKTQSKKTKFMSIEDKIRDFILKNLYYAENSDLTDDVSFLAEGIIDSMGSMELMAFVESEFKIKVEMSEVVVKNFDSIGKMAAFVRRKLGLPDGADQVVRPFPSQVNPSQASDKLEAA
jgi:acyl carrier protein